MVWIYHIFFSYSAILGHVVLPCLQFLVIINIYKQYFYIWGEFLINSILLGHDIFRPFPFNVIIVMLGRKSVILLFVFSLFYFFFCFLFPALCRLLEYFLEFHFDWSIEFWSVTLYIAFVVAVLGITFCILSQFTGVDILLVSVKCRNLISISIPHFLYICWELHQTMLQFLLQPSNIL